MEQEETSGATRRPSTSTLAPEGWDPTAFDVMPIGAGLWDRDARLVHANPVLCDLLGVPLSRLLHTDLLDLVVAEDRSGAAVAVVDLLEGRRNSAQCRLRGAGPDRGGRTEPWPLRMHLTTHYGRDGQPEGVLGQVFDFTPAETGPPLPEGLAQVLEEGSDFLLVIEANGLVSYGNRAAREALGVGAGRIHTRLVDLLDSDNLEYFQNVVEPALLGLGVWQGELSFRNRELMPVPVSARFVAHGVRPESDEPTELGTVSVFARDITELKNAERRLRQLATHDYLTGLPNRLLLYDRLELALNRYTRYGTPVALLFCDLDGFKPVNDVHGHQVGDAVLVEVAGRIHSVVRDTDTAARVGGDEFALLIEGVEDIDLLRSVAERLVARVAEPIFVGRVIAEVGVSIGLVVASKRCHQVDTLVALADSAMYQAKASGRGRYVVITGDDL
jgi:diguanylate cyclase (GGDEF)-like protein